MNLHGAIGPFSIPPYYVVINSSILATRDGTGNHERIKRVIENYKNKEVFRWKICVGSLISKTAMRFTLQVSK